MTAVTATVTRSIGEAARASTRLLERCIDHAVAELQAAELQAEKNDQRRDYADAWRELLTQRANWTARFPQLLHAAFDAAASGARAEPAATTLRPSSLTLVAENEIEQTIESSRLTQELNAMLERPLADLDALMSSALGLDVVQPERNPLRPEIFARTLRQLVGEGRGEPTWPGLWLRHMARPLAKELEQLYRDQSHLLTLARVQAAGYRLRGTPSRPAPLAPVHGGTQAGANSGFHSGHPSGFHSSGHAGLASGHGAPHAVDGPRASGSMPLQGAAGAHMPQPQGLPLGEFLQRGLPEADQGLASSYYAAIEEELAALEASQHETPYDPAQAQQYLHLPPVDRPPRHVGTDSPLPQEIWGSLAAPRQRALVRGRLKQQARELGQVYALEVVRKLVDQVAQDPRLLAPVREAIVGLEPSLLRLSQAAPRFFSDEAHPGRRLVERVAERSFAFNDEFSTDFQAFLAPVGQTLRRLNDFDAFDGAGPFRLALATLEAGWAAQDALEGESRRKVLGAVAFAEQRQAEADRIAGELAQREDLAGAHETMRDFVLRRWSLVVAQARLSDPQHGVDPGGYVALVSDLLWSVNSGLALREPARAFETIPRVVVKLRKGLAMLGEAPGESDAFFHQLERLHRPVLKLRARQRQGEVPSAERSAPPPAQPTPRGPDKLWMAEAELHAAGFEDTQPSEHGELTALGGDAPAPEQALGDAEAEQLLAVLAVNSWVDLFSRQQWRRARLVWTSGNGALFMFTSRGNRPHSMTRRSLQRLLRNRLLRLVEADAVVPRALETLASQRLPLVHAAAAHAH
ncbi:MAG: hypothetical protein JWQ76_4375 [Ramlibacter sp.]|nr:hypothetical protein [Ramlibacter sp.]